MKLKLAVLLNVVCGLPVLAATSPELIQTVDGNGDFAADLYRRLAVDEPGNLFFSPFSISDALAMTYGGARGKTAAQMEQVLHFGANTHAGFALLNKELGAGGKGYQLSVANRIFTQQGMSLLDGYLNLVMTSYGAPVEPLDFLTAAEKSRVHINTWVEQQTQRRIKDLIPQGVINASTRMVLANAIYFKGKWATAFDPKRTRPLPFDVKGTKVNVPTMFRDSAGRYADTSLAQIFELPYQGGDLSMVVLLPKKDLATLEKGFDRRLVDGSMSVMTEQDVQLYLPRFKLETKFELSGTLKKLGMTAAFEGADFSGITGGTDLEISAVVHKAFVEVNEEGTEAAAATAVVMQADAVVRPLEMRVDRPFLFAVRDNRSGTLLFLGRVVDPRG